MHNLLQCILFAEYLHFSAKLRLVQLQRQFFVHSFDTWLLSKKKYSKNESELHGAFELK